MSLIYKEERAEVDQVQHGVLDGFITAFHCRVSPTHIPQPIRLAQYASETSHPALLPPGIALLLFLENRHKESALKDVQKFLLGSITLLIFLQPIFNYEAHCFSFHSRISTCAQLLKSS